MLSKKSTVYIDPDLHKALRFKAAETEHSISELINQAIKLSLSEDAIDLAAFGEREKEPLLDFEAVVKKLKLNGKI